MANVTFDALIAKAHQRDDDKLKIKKVKCEALGGEITLKKPPVQKIAEILDSADEALGTYEGMRTNAALIYEAWPLVKDNYDKLKEEFHVADPYDLVIAMFDDNIAELESIAKEVGDFYGSTPEAVKN